jgi:ABC-type sugar transport system ATPase subunit
MTPPLRLELRGISKQYPAVRANDGVSLRVKAGEIHAVLGENGAGKSTLMKIIYGAVQPDEGQVIWNGQPVHVTSPAHARKLGISMVYQHFSLFDTLTAAENVWLGLDKAFSLPQVSARITEVAHTYGLDVDPQRPVHTLSVGERQRVEIVRALLTDPQLLILDEPTSVLTPQAVDKLFVTLRKLAESGCSISTSATSRRDPRAVPRLHRAARRQGHRRGGPGAAEQCQSLAPDDRQRTPGTAATQRYGWHAGSGRAQPEPASRRCLWRGPAGH